MNKSLFHTICIFSLGVFVIVWLCVIAKNTSPKPDNTSPHTNQSTRNNPTESQYRKAITPTLSHYLIKNTNGKINIYSVYSDGITKLEKTLDVHPDSLRKTDKLKFDEGIIINDIEALSHIIEDYVS